MVEPGLVGQGGRTSTLDYGGLTGQVSKANIGDSETVVPLSHRRLAVCIRAISRLYELVPLSVAYDDRRVAMRALASGVSIVTGRSRSPPRGR